MNRLVGDIGGTNARFAWVDDRGVPRGTRTFAVAKFTGLRQAIEAFAAGQRVTEVCVAVACPVDGDDIRLTNNPWRFSKGALKEALELERLAVINDFTALALSVPHLAESDVVQVGPGQAAAGGAIAVLGPGTGLGVSGLVPEGGRWNPISGEGGHMGFAPADETDAAILAWLAIRYGRVSAERILSGRGLENLYLALAHIQGRTADPLDAAEIDRRARGGDDPLAVATIERFLAILGSVAGDVALVLGATGGVYIGGGIVPRFADRLPTSAFRARFEDKGRMRPLVTAIPTFVITAPFPALLGAAARLGHGSARVP